MSKKIKIGITAWKLGYEKARVKAKKIYSKIGYIQCPAFENEKVAFTSIGFNHLVRRGKNVRAKNEQKRRFVLVQYVEEILKNPQAQILFERRAVKQFVNRHGNRVLVESVADFWTFIANVKNCRVKVVIRSINSNQKHFFSVMGDNIEIVRQVKTKKSPKCRT